MFVENTKRPPHTKKQRHINGKNNLKMNSIAKQRKGTFQETDIDILSIPEEKMIDTQKSKKSKNNLETLHKSKRPMITEMNDSRKCLTSLVSVDESAYD